MTMICISGRNAGAARLIAEVLVSSGRDVVIIGCGDAHIASCRSRALDFADGMVETMTLASHAIEELDSCWLVSDMFFELCDLFFIECPEKPLLEHSLPDWDWPALGVHVSQFLRVPLWAVEIPTSENNLTALLSVSKRRTVFV